MNTTRLTLGQELFILACLDLGWTYREALAALKARTS
jgi:hypothetical protein